MARVRDYKEALRQYGSRNAAAKAFGIARQTFSRGLRRQERQTVDVTGGMYDFTQPAQPQPAGGVSIPELPDPRMPLDELLKLRAENYRRRREAADARNWFKIKVHDPAPIGVLFMGDPHLDDDGCNLPLLMHHMELCRTVPGMWAVNIGDTINAWVGSLARLYGKQSTSEDQAHQLAHWFLVEAGVPWLCVLLGNHDLWAKSALFKQMHSPAAPMQTKVDKQGVMLEWKARFALEFPCGERVLVTAAHDFPGHSFWNPSHGPLREAHMGADADLLVCGHKHVAATQSLTNGRGRFVRVARASGYKRMDDYAMQLGFGDAPDDGSAVLAILDPSRTGAGRVTVFENVDMGVAVLNSLRRPMHATATRKSAPKSGKRRKSR